LGGLQYIDQRFGDIMGSILLKSKEKTEYRSLVGLLICIGLAGYGTIKPETDGSRFK